ncbi:MAG: redoxin domain-containing protein [Acidobacteria bacterium]|nr:redoxin domain-containing protein [Acidobacteriota bacterium]MBI3427253.1 redoxin domain-containing protein [Acidobacteriota bacterium]
MTYIRWVVLLCVLLGGLSLATANAQVKAGPQDGAGLPPADLQRIKVGDAAPDFVLEDQDGKPVQLSTYRGKKSVVLVFYRGYW